VWAELSGTWEYYELPNGFNLALRVLSSFQSIRQLPNGLAFEVEQLLKLSEQLPSALELLGEQHLESLGQLSTGWVLSVEGCVLF
jgi:hypothetical protein